MTKTTEYDRRSFIGLSLGSVIASSVSRAQPAIARGEPAAIFPRQDPSMVADMVRLAHFDVAKVKDLLGRHPALSKAAIDWGFGDWEDALGAASHMGRYDIAQLLLANGARPTLFSAAMMGQLDVVKSFIAAAPGSQRTFGPHSITLLAHARAGGDRARSVREYLEQLGGADEKPAGAMNLSDADRARYAGRYAFGVSPDDVLVVANEKTGLTITRPGLPFARGITAVGDDEFVPMGAEAVRIKFAFVDGSAAELRIFDPELLVTARRTSG